MDKYPIGLIVRNNYFRTLKSIWTGEVKDFVISRMKASVNNIKPVIVIDDTTKKTVCHLINEEFTGFDIRTGLEADILCRKVDTIANYMINKVKIQKSNLTVDEKEVSCKINELKHYRHKKMVDGLNAKLKEYLSKANLVESE